MFYEQETFAFFGRKRTRGGYESLVGKDFYILAKYEVGDSFIPGTHNIFNISFHIPKPQKSILRKEQINFNAVKYNNTGFQDIYYGFVNGSANNGLEYTQSYTGWQSWKGAYPPAYKEPTIGSGIVKQDYECEAVVDSDFIITSTISADNAYNSSGNSEATGIRVNLPIIESQYSGNYDTIDSLSHRITIKSGTVYWKPYWKTGGIYLGGLTVPSYLFYIGHLYDDVFAYMRCVPSITSSSYEAAVIKEYKGYKGVFVDKK